MSLATPHAPIYGLPNEPRVVHHEQLHGIDGEDPVDKRGVAPTLRGGDGIFTMVFLRGVTPAHLRKHECPRENQLSGPEKGEGARHRHEVW